MKSSKVTAALKWPQVLKPIALFLGLFFLDKGTWENTFSSGSLDDH